MRAEERKRQAGREIRRIYRALRRHGVEIELRWLFRFPAVHGECTWRKGAMDYISVDPFRLFVGTFVHEVLHHLEGPRALHHRINELEDLIMLHASPRQLRNLFAYFVRYWRTSLADRRQRRTPSSCPLCGRKFRHAPVSIRRKAA